MFDWVMASDRGKQQAYCKVCSKHFSVSHGGIDNVRRHGEGKKHFVMQGAKVVICFMHVDEIFKC